VFPFHVIVAMLCGWLQREQEDVIAFLREENRVLKARLEGHDSVWMTASVGVLGNWGIAWAANSSVASSPS
jgi:hypothetical protein